MSQNSESDNVPQRSEQEEAAWPYIVRIGTLMREEKHDEVITVAREARELLQDTDWGHKLLRPVLIDLAYCLAVKEDREAITIWEQLINELRCMPDVRQGSLSFDIDATMLLTKLRVDDGARMNDAGQVHLTLQCVRQSSSAFGSNDLGSLKVRLEAIKTLRDQHKLDEALDMGQHVLDERRRVLGDLHPDVLIAEYELAVSHTYKGNLENATEIAHKLLATRNEHHPADHVGLALTTNLLARLYNRQLRTDADATRLIDEAVNRSKVAFGEDDTATVGALYDAAASLSIRANSRVGSLDDQERRREKSQWKSVFEKCRATYGDEHPRTIISASFVSHGLRSENKLEEAAQLWRDVQARAHRIFKSVNEITAQFSLQLIRETRHAECLSLWRTAVETQRYFNGDEDKSMLQEMTLLVDLLWDIGPIDEAMSRARTAFELSKNVYGADNIKTLQSALLFTEILTYGSADEVGDHMKEFSERSHHLPESEDRETCDFLIRLAKLFGEKEMLDEAVTTWDKAHKISQKIHGETHPKTMDTAVSLAKAHFRAGESGASSTILKDLIHVYQEQGKDQEDLMELKKILVYSLLGEDKLDEVAPLQSEVITFYRDTLGPEDPSVIAREASYARMYHDAGGAATETAAAMHQSVLQRMIKVHGANEEDTVFTAGLLIEELMDLERWADATKLLEEQWPIRIRVLGPYSETSIDTARRLGACYGMVGQWDKAVAWRRTAYEHLKAAQGEDYKDTLFAQITLAVTLSLGSHHEAAAFQQRQVVAAYTRLEGDTAENTLDELARLIHILDDDSRAQEKRSAQFSERHRVCERLLQGCIERYGEDHERTKGVRELANK